MWWFLKRTTPSDSANRRDGPSSISAVLASFAALLDSLDAADEIAVKVWLPDPVANLVKDMAEMDGISQSELLRNLLLVYVYGRVAMAAQQLRKDHRPEVRFSRHPVDRTQGRWVYKVPQLGKNTVAFKLWCSARLVGDLAQLANHAGIELSPFIREAIIADLLGRGSLPERPEMFASGTPEAIAWERHEAVPVTMMDAADYDGLGVLDPEWIATPPHTPG